MLLARNAGTSPNKIPASNDTAAVKSSTRTLTEGLMAELLPVTSAISACAPQRATRIPAAPPKIVSSMLSVSSCRISLPRPAPIARRMEISFSRAAERERSRFATLAQTISSTIATITIRICSACA